MEINILCQEEQTALQHILTNSSRIVICAHKSPDGDAMGSSLGWASYLTSLGKQVTVVMPDAFPMFLQWLPGADAVKRFDKKPDDVQQAFNKADTVFCLDFNTTSRTEDLQPVIDSCKATLVIIDHHLYPQVNASLVISRPELSSTCEIIFSIIWQLGGYDKISQAAAQCLYCGMMTDTGGFTYNSTRPEIFFIISQLLAKGIDKDLIYNKVFHNYTEDCLRLRSYIIFKKLNVIKQLHASYYSVTRADMTKFHFQKGDLEGLVNDPLKMKGHKLSIAFREDTEVDGRILVSLRSSCGFHCQKMATEFFNGGGHADAAGGKLLNSNIAEAEQIALRAILAYKDELSEA